MVKSKKDLDLLKFQWKLYWFIELLKLTRNWLDWWNNFVSTRKLSEDHNINVALKIDQDYIDIKKYRIWRIVQEQSYLYKNSDIFNL